MNYSPHVIFITGQMSLIMGKVMILL